MKQNESIHITDLLSLIDEEAIVDYLTLRGYEVFTSREYQEIEEGLLETGREEVLSLSLIHI